MDYAYLFFKHHYRGTWFSNIHRRWYGLDGLLVKKQHWHEIVKNVGTIKRVCQTISQSTYPYEEVGRSGEQAEEKEELLK